MRHGAVSFFTFCFRRCMVQSFLSSDACQYCQILYKKFYCLRSLVINTVHYYLFIFKNYFDGHIFVLVAVVAVVVQVLFSLCRCADAATTPVPLVVFQKFRTVLPPFFITFTIFIYCTAIGEMSNNVCLRVPSFLMSSS